MWQVKRWCAVPFKIHLSRYDVKEGRPILESYMNKVRDQLNPHYDESNKFVRSLVTKFGGKVPGP